MDRMGAARANAADPEAERPTWTPMTIADFSAALARFPAARLRTDAARKSTACQAVRRPDWRAEAVSLSRVAEPEERLQIGAELALGGQVQIDHQPGPRLGRPIGCGR